MKNILWTQGETSTSSDVFVIDGKLNSDNGIENETAYKKLILASNRESKHQNVVSILHWRGIIKTTQFKYTYKENEGIYFQSAYQTKDDLNRSIAFMFYCDTNDINVAIETFISYSQMAKRTAVNSELKALSIMFHLNKYVITLVIISALIYIIWKVI